MRFCMLGAMLTPEQRSSLRDSKRLPVLLLALVTLVIKSIAEWRSEQEMKAIAELPPERPAPAVAPR